ncbi:energy transducer TonB [Lentisalinibacter sediminis]|uniref:energy transducer TonB n=1 Tax=Lentisalinibacter sediminis TaxID=2992237 RepID=UPI0038638B3D
MNDAVTRRADSSAGGHRRTADILLVVAGFVVVGLAAAWFLADRLGGEEEQLFEAPAPASPSSESAASGLSVSAAAGEATDVNLGKARMAASAGMLVEPAGQNALYFYSLVLDAEPEHAEAASELTEVAGEVAGRVRSLMEAGEFSEAARLASKLASVTPGHPVIVEVQETLIARQQRLVMEAVQAARDGDDGTAANRLAVAEALPQVDDALVETAREQIGAIRAERAAAAREAERRRQAAERRARQEAAAAAAAAAAAEESEAASAAAAPAEAVAGEVAAADAGEPAPPPEPDALELGRESLAAGRLVAPPDDNALAWLAQAEATLADDPGVAAFRARLVSAISVAIRDRIDAGALEEAEQLLLETQTLEAAEATVAALQDEVDLAFIRRESARVLPGSEMLATDIVPPVYPRAAIRREQEGWVDVEFTVLADGSTADAEVIEAQPERVFEGASLRAVEQWRFRPRVYRGRPIDQRVSTRINFQLQD